MKRPAKDSQDRSRNQVSIFPGLQERGLVLSLFPGIDLLGRGFEDEGYFVVRGPDLIWGQRIETFHSPARVFDGVIAGSPCQNFSVANPRRNKADGEAMLEEFRRLVTEAQPKWWLLENVPTVPDVSIEGYQVQRFDLKASEVGLRQSRLRHFQFGSVDGSVIVPERDLAIAKNRSSVTLASRNGVATVREFPGVVNARVITEVAGSRLEPCCMASEGKRPGRSFAQFCELQGLPADFDLPGWSKAFKYAAVGNGVPIPMARVIAKAIKARYTLPPDVRLCICKCGRIVTGRRKSATDACRKRMEKRRKANRENPDLN